MYYALIKQTDEYGLPYFKSARKGGFKSLQSAIRRVIKAGTGEVVDDKRAIVAVVSNGIDLMSRVTQSTLYSTGKGATPA